MADQSSIEWTEATWNPVAGCKIVSPGCTNCYAMLMAKRLARMGLSKYRGLTRRSGGRVVWTGVVREDSASLEIPLSWRKPRLIFVNSMSDLFHEDVSQEFIWKVWSVMERTPKHTYQILTKRPERMAKLRLPALSNVWLGTSIEDQAVCERLEYLKETPAYVRFVSFEPLIGSVGDVDLTGIDWAIVGGESGHNARIMLEEWVDEIHSKCEQSGVLFFFKQWGAWGSDKRRRSKKVNGRIYKGRTWDDMPARTQAIARDGSE